MLATQHRGMYDMPGYSSNPVELLRLSVLTGEGAPPKSAHTPRYAKWEGRPHCTPQTARPANGVPPSRVLYERPSAPYAVEWEDSPDESDQAWVMGAQVQILIARTFMIRELPAVPVRSIAANCLPSSAAHLELHPCVIAE
jgi:hypothetical protein